jgi:hypothetical protein
MTSKFSFASLSSVHISIKHRYVRSFGRLPPCSLITPHQPLQHFPNPVSPASQHHPIPIPRQAKLRSNVPKRKGCGCLRIPSCTTLDLHGRRIYRIASGAASSTPHGVNNDQATIYKRVEVNGDAELSPVWIGYIRGSSR